MLQIGLALFGGLSLGVLLVTATGGLIALRAALGIAAAAMAPITNSLVFRLFDDDVLRMRAITIMMVVGMSGFVVGPLFGGTMLAHLPWQWLLLINAPIALIASIGVHFGVPADAPEGLTNDRLDLPGAVLSILSIGLACYTRHQRRYRVRRHPDRCAGDRRAPRRGLEPGTRRVVLPR